jgi:hypothetical protein
MRPASFRDELTARVAAPRIVFHHQRKIVARYLNNCANRDHVALFGQDAFYDLDTSGRQASKQALFKPDDYCVVASEPNAGVIRFAWYRFTGSRLAADEARKTQVRVLLGKFVKEESMTKEEAVSHKQYHPFFDKNGKFRRDAVL